MNILTLLVALSQFTFSLWIPPKEVANLTEKPWKLPSNLSPWRMEKLLNQFAKVGYGKSFRYMGIDEDFFHGHLLNEHVNGGYYLRAILYHTQERAFRAHWKQGIDAKYDYIDPRGRNWLQFLSDDPRQDGVRIVNAREFAGPKTQFLDSFFNDAPISEKNHYTIYDSDLDRKKLGITGELGSMQVEFWRDQCDTLIPVELASKRGPIHVTLAEGKVECLHLATYNTFGMMKN